MVDLPIAMLVYQRVYGCIYGIQHLGMYQNQSCYIWGDEHPFTSYLGFTRVPRFWLIPKYDEIRFQVSGFGHRLENRVFWHVLACSGSILNRNLTHLTLPQQSPTRSLALVKKWTEMNRNEQKWTERSEGSPVWNLVTQTHRLRFLVTHLTSDLLPSDLTRSKAPKLRLAQFRSELGI